MYEHYFGLLKRPFVLTPDPEFLYVSRVHDLALTHLEYGLVHHVGFVALTGEVGAGKTTLLKYLFNRVKDSLDLALIFNTNLDPATFLEMLCREYGIDLPSGRKSDCFNALYQHFLDQFSRGNRCVILVDEAQNLPFETFEELRMLSNLEADSDFLVQIILVGQPQLRACLAHPAMTQLAQRISVHYHLMALSHEEVGTYIAHRLKVAGYDAASPLFSDDAVSTIAGASGGVPRLINSICDACLTYAYGEERRHVDHDLVEQVLRDNEPLRYAGVATGEACRGAADQVLEERDGHDRVPTGPLGDVSGYPAGLGEANGRLEVLERRIERLELQQQDRAISVLQEMLLEERKRNDTLRQNVIQLKNLCRRLQMKLESAEKSLAQEFGTSQQPQKTRRFPFGRRK